MPSDTPPPTVVNKKVPLGLWVILVLVCATGIAFFSLFRSSSRSPVKEELTPQQEEAIFSDIQKDNITAPESESSGATPEGAQKAADAMINDGDYARVKKVKDNLIAKGATPESAQEAVREKAGLSDYSGSAPAVSQPDSTVPAFSGTKALDVTPIEGVRLTAPENALDKSRTFRATPLSNAQLNELDKRLLPSGVELLGGFNLDAGMSDQDLFPGQLTIAIDLEKRGIPKELWDDLILLQEDSRGKLRLVLADRQGTQLICKVRHNSVIMTAVLLRVLAHVVDYAWQVDRAEVPQGEYISVLWPPDQPHFQLLYPRTWPLPNPTEVERVTGEINRLYAKYEVLAPTSAWSDKFDAAAERCQRLRRLEQDPDYQSLRDQLRSRKWLKDNFLPRRVAHGVDAMDVAYDYLCGAGGRGFRKPGVFGLEQVTEVYFVDQSMGPEKYGEARNCWTKSPFMVLDGTKMPDTATPDAEGRKLMDALLATAVHEFFHVIQCAYVLYDSQAYLWFNEATATVLEYEAKIDYQARALVTSWDDKTRFYDAFFQPLDYTADPAAATQHGYGASYFLEFIRDRYSKGNPRAFLPALLEDFAAFRGGVVNSLWRVTSGTPEGLQRDFRDFCRAHRDDLISAAPKQTMTLDKPFVIIPLEEARPLRVTASRVEASPDAFAPSALKGASLAILDTAGLIAGVTTSWQSTVSGWADAEPEICAAVSIPESTTTKRLSFLRCESYVRAPTIQPRGTAVFILAQPQQPPTATLVPDKLEVRVPATPLMRASLPSFGRCLRGYTLYLRGPANAPLVLGPSAPASDGGETVFTVSADELRTKLAGGKPGSIPLRITYAECPAGSVSLLAPESKPLTITWSDSIKEQARKGETCYYCCSTNAKVVPCPPGEKCGNCYPILCPDCGKFQCNLRFSAEMKCAREKMAREAQEQIKKQHRREQGTD